jgi:ketosteroid isomerase-like protein
MTIAADLLQRHIQTLVADNEQWQTLIADDLVWELPYAPTLGHPARLSGREEVVGFVTWFLGAVEDFRFFDLTMYPCADPDVAVAEVKAEARIKPTRRLYRQEYVVFLRRQAARSRSSANISILCGRPRRWTRPFVISNPEDTRRRARSRSAARGRACLYMTCITEG